MALFDAISERANNLKDLSFANTEITDESASYLWAWLKKMRARDVDHSMSIVACDLSMNKIMHKNTKDVEG